MDDLTDVQDIDENANAENTKNAEDGDVDDYYEKRFLEQDIPALDEYVVREGLFLF